MGAMHISNRAIAELARPFDRGGGPSHATLELVWAAADAGDYLGEGNKLERVLGGLRALRNGRPAQNGRPALPADEEKLQLVASDLAARLLAGGHVAPDALHQALDDERAPAAEDVREPTEAAAGDGPVAPSPDVERDDAVRSSTADVSRDTQAVMVVHGQDSEAARALFDWLRAVGLKPREWTQLVQASGAASPFIGDVLDAAFRESQAVVVLFTPDEHVRLRGAISPRAQWRLQARPNVLFEAGMAFAANPTRTVLVVLGEQQLPSDLAGRHFVQLDSAKALRDLARRLERAGCHLDLSGADWLDLDRFPDRSAVEAAPPAP